MQSSKMTFNFQQDLDPQLPARVQKAAWKVLQAKTAVDLVGHAGCPR